MTGPTVTDIARQVATLALADPDWAYPIGTCWNLVDATLLASDGDPWSGSLKLLRDELDRSEIDPPTDEQPLCCIVGQACLDSGIPADRLRNEANAYQLIREQLKLEGGWLPYGKVAQTFIEHVQSLQDRSLPWGQALRTAYVRLEGDFSDADLDALFGADLHEQLDRFAHPGKADK